jgi:hypothetical protein
MLKLFRCKVKTCGIQIQFGVDKKESLNTNAIYELKITSFILYVVSHGHFLHFIFTANKANEELLFEK